ncbi:MAG: retropepsin-like aspartic protease [Candidatus Omnitrophota bacterium]|nr:retropepsin-like aspartic protease [Candidatus Omnitrophota bacterium]
MNRKTVMLLFPCLILTAPLHSNADTIHFNNGASIDGIIKGEDANSVEMDIGFGTITCPRREIMKVERSSPGERTALVEKWEKKREELKAGGRQFDVERRKRFAEYDEWTNAERERAAKESIVQGTIDLTRDPDSKSILIDVLLDDQVKATLILDTGASIVVLTRKKSEELGLDLSDTVNDIAMLQLAGGQKVAAKMVMLKSVRIKDIEVKNVLAGVLLEGAEMGLKDGLLGMTFLNKFNLKIDLKNMKMGLEKTG